MISTLPIWLTDLPESCQATTFTVANLYYNQAILNRIADTFHVTFEKSSSIATLMQAGYAAGILFICPLGDIFRRRPFILALIAFTATLVSRPRIEPLILPQLGQGLRTKPFPV